HRSAITGRSTQRSMPMRISDSLWQQFLKSAGAYKPASRPFKIFMAVLAGLLAYGFARHFTK
ncbi:hypothetical protein, partial [Mycobacterium tuberculosis]|uniref:hypothetical protein n=1 Tax=Mycobacterium tuberculosis TaxID=1773 RepID=UPI0019D427C2